MRAVFLSLKGNIMDLAKLDTSKETATLHVLHPVTREPMFEGDKAMTIELYGSDSEQYRSHQRQAANENLKNRSEKGGQDAPQATAERIEQGAIDLLAACTAGWSGVIENGKEVKYTAAEVKRVYGQYRWIYEQVDSFVHSRANFLPKA